MIKQIAIILDFRFIPLYLSLFKIRVPNVVWLFKHFSSFSDDLEKNHAASKINGVVGIPGKKIPRNANPTNMKPKDI